MDRTHWTIVPLALVTLLNLPAVFASDHDAGPTGSGAVGTVLGVIGVVAIVALLRRFSWNRSITVTIGALNVAGGVWSLAAGYGNGIVGVVLGLAIVLLAVALPSPLRSSMSDA